MPKPSDQLAVLRAEAMALRRQMHDAAGDASVSPRIDAWRGRSALHERCWQEAMQQWTVSGAVQRRQSNGFDRARFIVDLLWERLCVRFAEQPSLVMLPVFCVVLVLTIPLLRQQESLPPPTPAATEAVAHALPIVARDLNSPAQEQRVYTLADGSIITLNWNSSATVILGDTSREVVLHQGEALFAVATDPNRPFTVAAGNVRARAVGTAFAVRRTHDAAASITVSEGIVEVTGPSAGAVQVHSNQHVDVDASRIGPVVTVDAASAMAWTDGMMIFRELPLIEVLAELGRYTTRELDTSAIRNADVPVTATYFTSRADDALQLVADAFALRLVPGASGVVMVQNAAPSPPQ